MANALQEPQLLAQAEICHGMVLDMLGLSREARSALRRGIQIADCTGERTTLCAGLGTLASSYRDAGKLERSRLCVERIAQTEERTGVPPSVAWAALLRGEQACITGDWKGALALHRQSVDLYRALPPSRFAAHALLCSGQLLVRMGEREQGLSLLTEALCAVRQQRDLRGLRGAEMALAELDLFEHRPDPAVMRLEPLQDRSGVSTKDGTQLLPVLAQAYLDCGDLTQAERTVGEGMRRARVQEQQMALLSLLRVRALVTVARGRWDDSEAWFDEALALLRDISCPYERARTLYTRGVLALRTSNRGRARAQFARALLLFHRLGARPYAERTRVALESLRNK
jgi:tetratricopeptide (TPR) repeat protein